MSLEGAISPVGCIRLSDGVVLEDASKLRGGGTLVGLIFKTTAGTLECLARRLWQEQKVNQRSGRFFQPQFVVDSGKSSCRLQSPPSARYIVKQVSDGSNIERNVGTSEQEEDATKEQASLVVQPQLWSIPRSPSRRSVPGNSGLLSRQPACPAFPQHPITITGSPMHDCRTATSWSTLPLDLYSLSPTNKDPALQSPPPIQAHHQATNTFNLRNR